MESGRGQFLSLVESGAIPPAQVDAAVRLAGLLPTPVAWRRFIDQLLLWLGVLALGCALLFLVAYNWQDLGRFARFALVEAGVLLAVLGYLRFGRDKVAGQSMLLLASLLTGVLLALYGQVYQTGADTWQLFFNWALLVLPWVLVARLPALWLLWLVLVNLAVALFLRMSASAWSGGFGVLLGAERETFLTLFALNTVALITWEWLSRTRYRWLARHSASRTLATAAGVFITFEMIQVVTESDTSGLASMMLWLAWLAALVLVYRHWLPDLYMLAGVCLSVIVVVTTFFGYHLLSNNADAGGFLLLALLIIGQGSAAAIWLKRVHRDMGA